MIVLYSESPLLSLFNSKFPFSKKTKEKHHLITIDYVFSGRYYRQDTTPWILTPSW